MESRSTFKSLIFCIAGLWAISTPPAEAQDSSTKTNKTDGLGGEPSATSSEAEAKTCSPTLNLNCLGQPRGRWSSQATSKRNSEQSVGRQEEK